MELVEVYTMVMLATGVTAASRMLAMLADSAVAGRYMAALLSVLVKTGGLRSYGLVRGGVWRRGGGELTIS